MVNLHMDMLKIVCEIWVFLNSVDFSM